MHLLSRVAVFHARVAPVAFRFFGLLITRCPDFQITRSKCPSPSYTHPGLAQTSAGYIRVHPKLACTLRCTLKVRQEIYPTDVMVKGEPLI
jgi:hypothetical protein